MSDILTVHPRINARQTYAALDTARALDARFGAGTVRSVYSAAFVQSFDTGRDHAPIAERVDVLGDYRHPARLVDCADAGALSLVLFPGGRTRWVPTHATRLGWATGPSPRRPELRA